MPTRTLTVRKGTGNSVFSPGWHTAVIQKAAYGDYNGTRYLDVYFKDFPETMNMRVYERIGKGGEEFAIGQIFRFANAGIEDGLDGPKGEVVIKMNDDPAGLVGQTLNVFVYKDGKYSRIYHQPAPTVFENVCDAFSDDDITYWKGRSEQQFNEYLKPKLKDVEVSTNGVVTEPTIPF